MLPFRLHGMEPAQVTAVQAVRSRALRRLLLVGGRNLKSVTKVWQVTDLLMAHCAFGDSWGSACDERGSRGRESAPPVFCLELGVPIDMGLERNPWALHSRRRLRLSW
jgi:hypothetical protein